MQLKTALVEMACNPNRFIVKLPYGYGIKMYPRIKQYLLTPKNLNNGQETKR